MRLLIILVFISSVCFGQGATHHTLVGHPSDQLVLNANNSHFFTADEVEAMELQPYMETYVQGTFYRNGTTNIAYSRDNADPYNQGGSFFRYDTGYGLRVPYPGINRNDDTDNHALSSMFFSDDSLKYYAFRTDPHQTPIEIFKARNQEDVSAWQQIFTEDIAAGTQQGYPKVFPDGSGNGVAWLRNRTGGTDYGTTQYRATNGGETWGSALQIIETINESSGYRIYPTMPLRYFANGWYFLEATKREGTPFPWVTRYLLKTQNFEDFYNYDETFSVDITSAAITYAQLEANYKIYANPSGYHGYIPVSSLDENGNYFTIVADTIGGPYNILYYSGGTWNTKVLSFPGETLEDSPLENQAGAFAALIVYNVNSFDVVIRCTVDVGGTDYRHLKLYRTYNFGDTFVLIGDLNAGIADNFYRTTWPFNYYDIPANKNFAIAMFTESSPAKALVTTLSKGAPEVDDPDAWTVSTISALSDIDSLKRHYRVAAADISNTGTTLTGMDDLSGGGFDIVTVNGSPQLDDGTTPTYLTFDGTNDYLEVPSTGIFTQFEGTIFAVVRHKTTNTDGSYILSAGASASARYHSFAVHKASGFNGSALMFNLNNGHGAQVRGQTTMTSDTNFAVVAMMCDNENTTLYVNGIRQYMDVETNGGTALVARADAAVLYSGLASLNRWTIGALRRSTTTYSSFDFKELAFYNRPLSEQEIMEVFKKLGADHSITIGDSFIDW